MAYDVNLPSPGAGNPLPNPVRAKMEGALGHNFSDVRVHSDGQAEQVGARAFASGSNLHFAQNQYDPATSAGQTLLGHELTHVVQQRESRVRAPATSGGNLSVVSDPALEGEADRHGAQAATASEVAREAPRAPNQDTTKAPAQRAQTALVSAVQQKPVVQPADPLTLGVLGIGGALASVAVSDAATVVGTVLALGAVGAQAAAAIMPGSTGVQSVQMENGWMSNEDVKKLEIVAQYRLVNAYIDQWKKAHPDEYATATAAPAATGTASPAPATTTSAPAAPTSAAPAAAASPAPGEGVDEAIRQAVKSVVELEMEEELNANQRSTDSKEYIWSDSGDHTADTFGTVGAIQFVDVAGTSLHATGLALSSDAKKVPGLVLPWKSDIVTIRQFRGGRLVRGESMETGWNDDLGINLVGGGPTIDQAGNEGHGIHTYATEWNWDDNTTLGDFHVEINSGGTPRFEVEWSRTPED